jgi:hypothetical protein
MLIDLEVLNVLKGHGNEADCLGFLQKLVLHILVNSTTGRVGESLFDYEYLREFEAKIGTARNVV